MNIQTINKNNVVLPNQITKTPEKITLTEVKDLIQNYAKSDSFSKSPNSVTTSDAQNFISLVSKILYNPQFREVAINTNPVLKEAYDNFISSIAKDDSELGEYIKSILSDSSKFSGDFFDALNKLMLQTNDVGTKSSIYNFLKVFDYYFTQTGNAHGVNSSFDELLSSLPQDIQDVLLNLFATGTTSQLNMFLQAIFDTKLPDSDKLNLMIGYLQNILTGKNTTSKDEPLDFFMPTDKLSNETLNYIYTIADKLNNLGIVLPKEIATLTKNLDYIDSNSQQSNNNEVFSTQTNNIDKLVEIAENVINQKSNVIYDNLNDLIKSLEISKQSVTYNSKDTLKSVLDNLATYSSHSENSDSKTVDVPLAKTLFENLHVIRNEILLNDNYLIKNNTSQEYKSNIETALDKLTSSLLDKLIYSDNSKNKCELLLNVYEKNIIPVLLKNNDIVDKNALSILTHNLLRLKLGTASEFSRQVTYLFEQLERTNLADNTQLLNMKLSLIEKLLSNDDSKNGLNAFVNLLDNGIKNAANESIKATFQNTISSLISKDDLSVAFKYFFIPLVFNGKNVLSQITIQKEKKKNAQGNNILDDDDTVFKITLTLDIKDKGVFNILLLYCNSELSAKLTLPKEYKSFSEAISGDITDIIEKNELIAREVVVEK